MQHQRSAKSVNSVLSVQRLFPCGIQQRKYANSALKLHLFGEMIQKSVSHAVKNLLFGIL